MFNIQRITVLMVLVMSIFLGGCDDEIANPIGPGNIDIPKDTSIFIGTWVSVFDTSDITPGTKEAKLMHWCNGGDCADPDTFYFNDSITESYSSGFQYYYKYSDDSIYYYSKLVGTNNLVFESSNSYHFSNDTVYSGPDTTYLGGEMYIFYPVSVRLTSTVIPKRIN